MKRQLDVEIDDSVQQWTTVVRECVKNRESLESNHGHYLMYDSKAFREARRRAGLTRHQPGEARRSCEVPDRRERGEDM